MNSSRDSLRTRFGAWCRASAYVTVFAAAPVICSSQAAGADPMDLRVVISAMKSRQDAIRTAEFRWTTIRTDKKGAIPARVLPNAAADTVFPAEDTTYPIEESVLLDGTDVRYEYKGSCWDLERRVLIPTFLDISAATGRGVRSYNEVPDRAIPRQGVINGPNGMTGFQRGVQAKPLAIYLRPLAATFGNVDESAFRVASVDASPDGHDLVTLERRGNGAVVELVLDRALRFSPVRMTDWTGPGVMFSHHDVTYTSDATTGWRPQTWTTITFDKSGAEISVFTSNVTLAKLNLDIPREGIELKFPDGTVVVDDSEFETGGPVRKYIAGPKGELSTTLEAASGISVSRICMILVNVGALAVILLEIWRRRRLARQR